MQTYLLIDYIQMISTKEKNGTDLLSDISDIMSYRYFVRNVPTKAYIMTSMTTSVFVRSF